MAFDRAKYVNRLREIQALVGEKTKAVEALFDKGDKTPEGVETPATRDQIITLNKEIEELNKEGLSLREILDYQGQREDIPFDDGKTDPNEAKLRDGDGLGSAFVNSSKLREWMKGDEGRGRVLNQNVKWETPQIQIGSFFREYPGVQQVIRDLLGSTSDAVGGAFVPIDRKPDVGMGYQKEITIFDLLTMGGTLGETVEYMRITGVTNSAAGTPQASATGDGSGAAPESAMAFSRVQENVKDITHWIPVTNNLLNDAAQTRTEIDNFLTYGVRQKTQFDILNGAGGDTFTGIKNIAGITAQAWDTNILTTTRKARTKVRIAGRHAPTGYVLHPTDWETIDLGQDNEARYYYGGPQAIGQKRLWGLPVVECEDVNSAAAGVGYCASWNLAVLWDRAQSAIFASNSHSDFFTRRITALLGVYRGAFGVKWPAAFVEMDLTA